MAACASISVVAAPALVRIAAPVRGYSNFKQQIGMAAAFPSLRLCKKQCVPRRIRIRASQEGVPQEILEDSKFVPIKDDDPRFGPPVMMLLGFSDGDVTVALDMLKEMGGDFMQVVLCTEEMLNGTLNEAFSTIQPDIFQVKAKKDVPPVCFLSGLSGEELMMVVRAFPEAGLTGIAFAAHVPKNSDKPLKELVGEIMGDHERLSGSKE
jgi:hypothetical protein